MISYKPILASVVFVFELLLIVSQDARQDVYFRIARCVCTVATEAVPLGLLWHEHQYGRAATPIATGLEKLVILIALFWNALIEGRFNHKALFGCYWANKTKWTIATVCIIGLMLLFVGLILLIIDTSLSQSNFSSLVRYIVSIGFIIIRTSALGTWMVILREAQSNQGTILCHGGSHLCFLILSFIVLFLSLFGRLAAGFDEILALYGIYFLRYIVLAILELRKRMFKSRGASTASHLTVVGTIQNSLGSHSLSGCSEVELVIRTGNKKEGPESTVV